MNNNYNAANYAKGTDGAKANDEYLREMNTSGKCNSCKYFQFGGYKCNKKTEDGKLVRSNMLPITYTEETSKGKFINVLRPTSCKDYESKGYKVLDPHVKAIYGDSITIQRCQKIFELLIADGFACNNVALGVGSFSMMCVEEDNMLKPFTRDTYSIAIKATYGEVDGKPIMIFKNPKTDTGFKKSQKGMCFVYKEHGEIKYQDGFTAEDVPVNGLFQTVFEDGVLYNTQTLSDVRNMLYEGGF